jgi:hypothetical protein
MGESESIFLSLGSGINRCRAFFDFAVNVFNRIREKLKMLHWDQARFQKHDRRFEKANPQWPEKSYETIDS